LPGFGHSFRGSECQETLIFWLNDRPVTPEVAGSSPVSRAIC